MRVLIYDALTGRGLATLSGEGFPADAGDIRAVYAPEGEPRLPMSVDAETGEIAYDNSYTGDVRAAVMAERLNALEAASVASGERGAAELLALAPLRPAWRAGMAVWAGMLLNHGGALWQVMQGTPEAPIAAQAHQPPGSEGTLAVYAPVRAEEPDGGGGVPEWLSGEQGLSPGDRRAFGGAAYEAAQPPGANIWPPDTAPAIWREAE
jgi:hypothetical protein